MERHRAAILRAMPGLRTAGNYGSVAASTAARQIFDAINDARERLRVPELYEFGQWLRANGVVLGAHPFPRTPRGIRVASVLTVQNMDRELAFLAGYLRGLTTELAQFHTLHVEFTRAINNGDAASALATVFEVEKWFGSSIWSTTQCIAPYGALRGLEAQKHLSKQLRTKVPKSGLVQYLVFYASVRAEAAVTAQGYEEAVTASIATVSEHVDPDLVALIVRHLLPYVEMPLDAVRGALALDATGTAVDSFLALRWATLHGIHHGAISLDTLALLRELALQTGDSELAAYAAAGEHRLTNQRPLRFWASQSAPADSGLWHNFRETWRNLVAFDPADQAAVVLPMAQALLSVGTAPYRESLRKAAMQRVYDLEATGAYAAIAAETLDAADTPWHSTILSIVAGTHWSAGQEPMWPDTDLGALDRAMWLLQDGQASASVGLLRDKSCAPATIWYCRWSRALVRAITATGDLAGALRAVSTSATADSAAVDSLPLRELAEHISKPERRPLARTGPDLAILYDLLCRHRGLHLETERRHAAEDYLASLQCKRPSHLRDHPAAMQLPRKVLVYFLEQVCVESVIDKFRDFKGPREVAEERVEICRWLAELTDPESPRAEVTALLRRLMIAEGMEKLQRSKVFVGLEGFRQGASKKTRELYDRFAALSKASPDEARRAAIEAVKKKVEEGRSEDFLALTLPKNELSDLMTRIATTLRDEFVHGPHHGLDGYLSVRIRHGAVRNFLRAPFDDEGLSTVKAEIGEGAYEDNPRWELFLGGLPPDSAASGRRILRELARRLDDQVVEINQWLQVSTSGEGPGLFDFALTEPAIAVFVDSGALLSFEEFIEQIEVVFLGFLDRNLANIRARIRTTAKQRASESVREAMGAFESMVPFNADSSEIMARLNRLHTSLQNTFENLAEWFQRTPAIASEPFGLEDPVRIAAESVRRGSAGIAPRINVSGDGPTLIDGVFFQPLADIFALLIDNAVRHGGTDNPDIEVLIESREGAISFELSNRVSAWAAETAEAKVREIQPRLNDASKDAYVRREGGSGIYKLHKILMHDLGVKPELRIEVREHRFVVSFQVSTRMRAE